MTLKAPTVLYTFLFNIMSRSIALGMLRQGNNGEQILNILETIYQDIRTEVCESEGIADCPENEDEIQALLMS